jgi:hypothetical protein
MKTIATVLLLFAATLAFAAAEFVTSPGTYPFFDGEITVEVDSKNEFIHYMISNDVKAGGGCKEDRVLSASKWFIYPESTSHIWVFEGTDNLKLIEIKGSSIKFSDTRVIPTLIDKAPKVVKEKYLKGIQP